MATDKNPSRLVAQAIPSLSYTEGIVLANRPFHLASRIYNLLWIVKRGKAAPDVYLTSPLAANAEAPFSGPYTSRRYEAVMAVATPKQHPKPIPRNVKPEKPLSKW